ncbi:MAG: FtsQ-type POTRA domain-containing protein [Proteobacteria bacterium]|nr:FtsQ-type POTRA domain-containing protein [Pseudomonadota bacterium]
MKLFNKKGDDSRARRSARLRILRVREFAMVAGVLATVVAMGFAGYHSNSFKKINSWARLQALMITANAGFKVKDILVTGRTQVSADELLAHLSIKENAPILGVDIAEAQKSLAGLAWVKDVSISRRLPDRVLVELRERSPEALWQYQRNISVIDLEGVVLPVADLADYKQLPLVVGADAPAHVMELVSLLKAEPDINGQLASAVRVGSRRWDLHLKNGVTVKLPEQDMELALSYLAAVEKQKGILDRRIVSIDLRQPEKMIVMPENETVLPKG